MSESSWDYRVCKTTDSDGEDHFDIREVFFNDEDQILANSAEAESPHGNTLEELEETLKWMTQALRKPVLDLEKIVYAKMPGEEEYLGE